MNNDNVKEFGSKANPTKYYVVGLPWYKNRKTGNYSCLWRVIQKQDKDFYFILKKTNGQIVGSAFVPRKVVLNSSSVIWKEKTTIIPDPNDPTKTVVKTSKLPIALIPKEVVHNWTTMDEYKHEQFA